jgi:hypothetical protein
MHQLFSVLNAFSDLVRCSPKSKFMGMGFGDVGMIPWDSYDMKERPDNLY